MNALKVHECTYGCVCVHPTKEMHFVFERKWAVKFPTSLSHKPKESKFWQFYASMCVGVGTYEFVCFKFYETSR